jgi:hypothetical protein
MEALRYAGAIALVLGLLAVVVHRFGRGGLVGLASGQGRGTPLERLGWVRLTPQHTLHLVRCGRQTWLLACHPGGTEVVGNGTGSEAGPAGQTPEERAGGARA